MQWSPRAQTDAGRQGEELLRLGMAEVTTYLPDVKYVDSEGDRHLVRWKGGRAALTNEEERSVRHSIGQ